MVTSQFGVVLGRALAREPTVLWTSCNEAQLLESHEKFQPRQLLTGYKTHQLMPHVFGGVNVDQGGSKLCRGVPPSSRCGAQ